MGNEAGFTRHLGFRDQTYVLHAGFNEAGAISSVQIEAGAHATKGQRIVTEVMTREIMRVLESGLELEKVAQSYTGARTDAVRGCEGVVSAANPSDMIMQVLAKAKRTLRVDAQGRKSMGHLRLV